MTMSWTNRKRSDRGNRDAHVRQCASYRGGDDVDLFLAVAMEISAEKDMICVWNAETRIGGANGPA